MLAQEMHARYAGAQLSFNTMDPTSQIGLGADTKMLRAGWGSWGAPASQATISAEMMVGSAWEGRSGEGFSSRTLTLIPIPTLALALALVLALILSLPLPLPLALALTLTLTLTLTLALTLSRFSSRREVADTAARRRLWDECVRLTGAVFPED